MTRRAAAGRAVSRRVVDRRIRLLIALFAVMLAATTLRATWLQAVRAQGLDDLASSQHGETVTVPAHRGTIYARMGVELAVGERATTVYANPTEIREPVRVARLAARLLGVDPVHVLELVSDRSRGFVYVARKANPRKAAALERLGIVGLGFYPEERRTYPHGPVGAEVVGYAGVDNHGLAGIELGLERQLAGTSGLESIVRDPFGRTLRVDEKKAVRDGLDVHLTLDTTLQEHVERVLRKVRVNWGARSATAVVLDPRSGEVLANAVEPGFDSNRFDTVEEERQRNRAVTDAYEPGSTFKIVTLAGALETGMVEPTTAYTLPYEIEIADRKIHDASERGTKRMTVAEILSQSSNVGVVTLALELGKDELVHWIERFGFGKLTGIDYPGETEGIAPAPERWSGSTIGNVPIGQGIAVTAVQMVRAFAAIANGGVAVQPHLVARVEGSPPRQPDPQRLFSEKTARQLTRMLRAVVEEGSGKSAKVPGYSVAGKTGTAAKPDPVSGGYSHTRYVSSFVGFLPASAPRVVVLVTVDEPRGQIWGGTVAAPAFAEIARFAVQYLQVPPDRPGTAATEG